MQAEFTKTDGNFKLEVFHDEDRDFSPREDDNQGTMVFFGDNFRIGDKSELSMASLEALCKRKDVVSLPVYAYVHGGVSISTEQTGQYADCWDSGQLGRIYITREKYLAEQGGKYMNRKKALRILESEVKELNDYLTGNIWGYKITDTRTGEESESCWGFIGDVKYAKEEGVQAMMRVYDVV